MKIIKIITCLMLFSLMANAQDNLLIDYGITASNIKIPRLNIGVEAQWYPAGLIYGARADLYLGKHTNWNFRLAYNDIDRKDFSIYNDSEKGGGLGASLGYRYYFGKRKGLFLGGRADIWQLAIDWQDMDDNMNLISGKTDITVLQPTVEVGYQFLVNKHWMIAPAFTNGFEINAKTKGEQVMEGFITLIGVNVSYKLL